MDKQAYEYTVGLVLSKEAVYNSINNLITNQINKLRNTFTGPTQYNKNHPNSVLKQPSSYDRFVQYATNPTPQQKRSQQWYDKQMQDPNSAIYKWRTEALQRIKATAGWNQGADGTWTRQTNNDTNGAWWERKMNSQIQPGQPSMPENYIGD